MKKNFLALYSNFCILGPYKYNLKFYSFHIAYSALVFLMALFVVYVFTRFYVLFYSFLSTSVFFIFFLICAEVAFKKCLGCSCLPLFLVSSVKSKE